MPLWPTVKCSTVILVLRPIAGKLHDPQWAQPRVTAQNAQPWLIAGGTWTTCLLVMRADVQSGSLDTAICRLKPAKAFPCPQ